MTIFNEFLLTIKPKTNHEVQASDQFRRFYGNDVFQDNDLSNIKGYTALKPEYKHLAGKWDAFAHAYSSAFLSRSYGESLSRLGGHINELRPNNSPESKNQDLWNNDGGIKKNALSNSINEAASKIYEGIENGELIIDKSSDKRIYTGNSKLSDISSGEFDSATVNKSLLNVTINTDLNSGFQDNQDTTQVGNAIGGFDWRASTGLDIINGDGVKLISYDNSQVIFDVDNEEGRNVSFLHIVGVA